MVASLRLLVESVKAVRVPEQPRCSASLLLRLENNINNYLLIVSHLQLSVSRTKDKEKYGLSFELQINEVKPGVR